MGRFYEQKISKDAAGARKRTEVPRNETACSSQTRREPDRIQPSRQSSLRNGSLLESLDRRCLVFLHVKHGVELGDLQQVVYLLGEVQQLEFAALVLGGGKGADQLDDAGA